MYRKHVNIDSHIERIVNNENHEIDQKNVSFDIQIGHNNRMTKNVYDRFIYEFFNNIETQRILLRKINVKWHNFLQFDFVRQFRFWKNTMTIRQRNFVLNTVIRRWRILFDINVTKKLHKLIDFQTKFRNV